MVKKYIFFKFKFCSYTNFVVLGLRIESFAIIKLRGVTTKFKKYIYILSNVSVSCAETIFKDFKILNAKRTALIFAAKCQARI